MPTLAETFEASAKAVAAGDYDKALQALIWIHDNPDPADPRSEMFRRACGFSAFGVLAGNYAPAKTALIDLVTKKRDQVAAGLADAATKADLRALEAALRHADA